jgi:lipopolysaccharide heptosyltransferase II
MWIALPQSSTNIARELRDMLFARMSHAKWAFGFNIRTTSIFKHEQALSRTFESEVEFLLKLVHKAGIGIEHDEGSRLQLPVNLNLKSKLHALLETGMPILAIAPGAKRPTNRWASERFAEIAKRWSKKLGYVVVLGGASDEVIGEQIANVNSNQILNLCGQTDVVETMCLLKQCTVALTNDSGPMHMAVAVKLPVVVAFSARDFPGLWHPTSTLSTVIRKKVDCSPCLAENCFNGNLCLDKISVEEVWEKIEKYFFVP